MKLLALFLITAALFLVANRGAYQGYFSDDDLDNLTWPTFLSNRDFLGALASPKFDPYNFRPVGFLYYRFLGRAFQHRFIPYVACLQALHALNIILLFFLLRRLAFSEMAAGMGALFYAFHAAVLEAYWKPMYVFDVLCGMFCVLTLVLYVRGRWLLALVPFWLAYKCKEIAVMLPIALLAYELLLGGRRWKRLIVYFAISLSFGLQALWANRGIKADNVYALHFSPQVLWNTIAFYSSTIFFLPFAGLALLLLPIIVRDRRLVLGFVFMLAMLVPMLVLSQRIESVYWYVPLIGLAIVAAAIGSRTPHWAVALFFLLWFPLNYAMLREKRREILALSDENRWYTTGLLDYAKRVPPLKAVVYQGTPAHMQWYGVEGAIRAAFGYQVHCVWYKRPEAAQALAETPMAVVGYYPVPHKIKSLLRTRDELQSYFRLTDEIPNYQLGPGWSIDLGDRRWAAARAEIRLRRPADSKEFEIVADAALTKVTVIEDGIDLGTQTWSHPDGNPAPLRWKLRRADAGDKNITVCSEPARPEQRAGIDVRGIGYVAQ